MSSSRLLTALAVLVICIALIGPAWADSPAPTLVQAKDLSTPDSPPAQQGEPIGIEVPLGRYKTLDEPSLAAGETAPAPSVLEAAAPPVGANPAGIGMEVFNRNYLTRPPEAHSPANSALDWDKDSHGASAEIGGTAGWFDYPGAGDPLNAMREPVVAKRSPGFYDNLFGFDVPTSPSTAYLPVVSNNYKFDPSQLLRNRGFDSAAWDPWETAGAPRLDDQVYRSASYSARLAGRNDVDSDYVVQGVMVPASATKVTLDYWFRVSGNDSTDPPDFMCVEILDGTKTMVLVPVVCYALSEQPQNQWINEHHIFPITELASLLGNTVYVSFQGWTNSTNPSTVWVDDVSLYATD